MAKVTKIYLDETFTTYTYPEIPGAVITDISSETLETGARLELFKVQYDGCTQFVVLFDKKGKGNTVQYKTLKTAQNKFNKFIENERKAITDAFSAVTEEDMNAWEKFRTEAISGYKRWKKVVV